MTPIPGAAPDATPPPPGGHRGGATFDPALDTIRLNAQAADVWRAMRSGAWRTLREIADATGHPEASVSARLRDYRKDRFGAHEVERKRIAGGLFAYRLVRAKGIRVAMPKPAPRRGGRPR